MQQRNRGQLNTRLMILKNIFSYAIYYSIIFPSYVFICYRCITFFLGFPYQSIPPIFASYPAPQSDDVSTFVVLLRHALTHGLDCSSIGRNPTRKIGISRFYRIPIRFLYYSIYNPTGKNSIGIFFYAII